MDVPSETGERELVVDDAVRSANDAHVLRFFDDAGRERALVPLQRVDPVRFER